MNFVFSGMTAEREKLRSGVFRASGVRRDRFSSGVHEADWDIFGAFDQGGEYYRFDQYLPLQRNDGLPQDSMPEMADLLDRDAMRFVRTPDRKLFWYARNQDLAIYPLDRESDPILKAFDVRALGLAGPISMDAGRTYQTMVQTFLSRDAPVVERLANRVTTISYVVMGGELRETLWIDEKRGYVPFRTELRINIPDFPRSASFPDTEHYEQEIEVGWDNRGGTWVPISVSANTKTISLELAFDWESVNQPVPADLFTPEGLKVPDHTLMIDHRLGEAIVLGNMQGPLPKGPTLKDPGVERRWWLIGLNTALIVGAALAAWYMVRRRKTV
ncbi:MAG: hypothetical protein O3C40_24645 [Planctomycetota bacterium]|nr:hypothetical protein [Planctomycetota bacterium]